MRVVTILGSPRKRGNTATVLGRLERLLAPAHQVERINVVDHRLQGCLGCDACQKVLERPACVQKDDGLNVLGRLLSADIIVYATPVYAWCFPAQMKALIDRHYCLVKWRGDEVVASLLAGKRAALLATCGGTANENADLMEQVFRRQMRCAGCDVLGIYVLGDCTTPAALGARANEAAARMAADISRLGE